MHVAYQLKRLEDLRLNYVYLLQSPPEVVSEEKRFFFYLLLLTEVEISCQVYRTYNLTLRDVCNKCLLIFILLVIQSIHGICFKGVLHP